MYVGFKRVYARNAISIIEKSIHKSHDALAILFYCSVRIVVHMRDPAKVNFLQATWPLNSIWGDV